MEAPAPAVALVDASAERKSSVKAATDGATMAAYPIGDGEE